LRQTLLQRQLLSQKQLLQKVQGVTSKLQTHLASSRRLKSNGCMHKTQLKTHNTFLGVKGSVRMMVKRDET